MYSEHLLILWTCFKCVSSSPQLHIEISAYIIFPYKPFTRSIWNFQMKAMEEEVLIKNGEIKILRDSLHQTESILEEQRRSHFLLEQEKTQALSEKEKEFSKKVTQRYVLLVWTSALPAYWFPLESMPKVAYKSPRKISAVVCWKYFCYQLIICTFLWGSVAWKRT